MHIGIIGTGRVASALARALHAHFNLCGIASRSPEHAATLANELDLPVEELGTLIGQAELIILAVSDDAIVNVAEQLAQLPQALQPRSAVHCSGALALEPLQALATIGWQVGAWHPLQSFPTRTTPVTAGITWGITAQEPLHSHLQELTTALGGIARDVLPEAKTRYHAAAALACNYAITLAAQAVSLLASCGFSAEDAEAALLPLLKGNLAMLEQVGLPQALTGPLSRGDIGTIARHLADLDQHAPDVAELYRACGRATLPLLHARNLSEDTITTLAELLT